MRDDSFDHLYASEGSGQTSVPFVREITLRPSAQAHPGQEAAPGKAEPGEFTRLFQSVKPLQPAAAPAQREALDISQLLRSLDLRPASAPMPPPASPEAVAGRSPGASGRSVPPNFSPRQRLPRPAHRSRAPLRLPNCSLPWRSPLKKILRRRAEPSPLPSALISHAQPVARETGPEAGLPGILAGGDSEATRIFAAPRPAIPVASETPSRPQPAIAGALERYLPLLVLLNAGLLIVLGALLIFFLLRRH